MTTKLLNRQFRAAFFPGEDGFEDDAGDEYGGKQVGEKAEDEGDCEASDRAGAEDHQDEGRDDGGDVSIHNGVQGVFEALLDGDCGGLAEMELFADALEDEDVGVDAHTDGEDDAGDSGQS